MIICFFSSFKNKEYAIQLENIRPGHKATENGEAAALEMWPDIMSEYSVIPLNGIYATLKDSKGCIKSKLLHDQSGGGWKWQRPKAAPPLK